MKTYPHDDHCDPDIQDRLQKVLSEIRKRFPSWRYAQMIDCLSLKANSNPYDVEDAALLAVAEAFLERDRDPYEFLPASTAGAAG